MGCSFAAFHVVTDLCCVLFVDLFQHGDVSVTQAEMMETEQRYIGDWPVVGLFRGSR